MKVLVEFGLKVTGSKGATGQITTWQENTTGIC